MDSSNNKSAFNSAILSVATVLVRGRYFFACFGFMLVGLALLGIPNFKFSADLQSFFDPDSASYQEYQAIANQFNTYENSIVYVLDAGESSVLTPEYLKLLRSFTQVIENETTAIKVLSLSNAVYVGADGDSLLVDELFSEVSSEDPNILQQRIEYAKNSDLIKGRLLSESNSVTAILAQYELPKARSNQAVADVIDQANNIKSAIKEQSPNTQVYLIGDLILEQGMHEVSSNSLITLYPVIMLIGGMILWLFFRSIPLIFAGFSIITCATLFTLGMAGWLDIVFDHTSILSIILVFIIVLADMVHVNVTFQDRLKEGDSPLDALIASLDENLIPIFLTTLTTAIGFLCLNACTSPPLVTLGNLTALGVVSAFAFTLFILPAAISFMRIKKANHALAVQRVIVSTVEASIQKPLTTVLCFTVIVAMFAPFILQNKVEDDPVGYFQEDDKVRVAFDFSSENLANRQQLNVSIAPQDGDIFDPEFVANLKEFESWILSDASVRGMTGFHHLLDLVQEQMDKDAPDGEASDVDASEALSQYWFLYEMSLPANANANDFVNQDKTVVGYNVLLNPITSKQLLENKQMIQGWFSTNLPSAKVILSSEDVLFASMSHEVVESMVFGSVVSLLLISLVMLISFKSFKYGVLSLVPNALPALVVYGVWGYLVGEVNMSVAITFSISLGLIVDDSVHIMSRYVSFRQKGVEAREAILTTLQQTGPALLVTSAMIASGLAVLSFSDYGVHSLIGWITAPIIVSAIVLDFYLLPALLVLIDKKRSYQLEENKEVTC